MPGWVLFATVVVSKNAVPWWERLAIVAGVLVVTAIVAEIVDRRIARIDLRTEAATRYKVLRRTITTVIFVVGILSALLVIPQVRAIASGLLASSAVLGLVIGFAARSTLANWVAGLMIALTQPLRLGDTVSIGDATGTVEEIGLSYTFIRTHDNDRIVIPNEKLASDTITNSTIVSRKHLAEVTVQVPLDTDLPDVVAAVRDSVGEDPSAEVLVTGLGSDVTVTVRTWAPDADKAREIESDLRLRVHSRLRERKVFA